MRQQLEPAYVLHSRPYRETSLILEAFSRQCGRVGLVARGARGARSRWKNMLQPFRPLLLSWTQRGEMGTLTGADQVASPPALVGEALFCGIYVNELLIRFLQRSDPHPGLFDDYRRLLGELAAADAPQPALRLFEARLLEAAGFALQLEHEHGSEEPIAPGRRYLFLPEAGAVRREDASGDAEELVSGEALLALRAGVIEAAHQRELKYLMRRLIRYHLGDRPLKSQSLFVGS
ncbi:MAG: DNA repair protein RecO [Xanthomonadales bacterium]